MATTRPKKTREKFLDTASEGLGELLSGEDLRRRRACDQTQVLFLRLFARAGNAKKACALLKSIQDECDTILPLPPDSAVLLLPNTNGDTGRFLADWVYEDCRAEDLRHGLFLVSLPGDIWERTSPWDLAEVLAQRAADMDEECRQLILRAEDLPPIDAETAALRAEQAAGLVRTVVDRTQTDASFPEDEDGSSSDAPNASDASDALDAPSLLAAPDGPDDTRVSNEEKSFLFAGL